ncbi:nuclear transport factor 2 family protein [Xanthomonas prunicola]|uniref:Nuclear transport factor 2 family protein n=1 Tax=Xanthomonas prunicola TaxID=2053930 RepID=A0A9Q9J012_9XANT|nr:nuclear transport factor 2 family protein [Xanthomonas prunicola]USJ01678.1 nuclear transport factor 2 family protein [Xanthomonas prunicola]UXA50164.1 nuclear transport factor 2 family protein [Xanthomonas prunicola]UXA52108.1 nuclear transport factor 2 family protein [Xanthomonas prunicola]UXA58469.1 nuclear transport factor 2 family protein [Xanthomonas prunicola]UXA60615.1 nuclear transport factor 2 family protein [Xanthomonas prunicola]
MHEDVSIIIACEQAIRRFALYNDRHDHAGLAALFTDDGVFARPSAPDAPVRGRQAILQSFRERPPRTTCHLMLNTVVSVQSHTSAHAHSHVLLYTADDTSTPPPWTAQSPALLGSFDDVLVLDQGRWLFQQRLGSLLLRVGTG